MEMSAKAWLEYAAQRSNISQRAIDMMQAWLDKNPDAGAYDTLNHAYNLVMRYGQATGALSCKMYEATAEAQGTAVATAEMADLPSYDEVGKAVNGTMKQSKSVADTVGRLIKQVGEDTILKNARRDGAEFAWVPSGDSCAFCITLASRGWQHMSKAARNGNHAEHIHANCDCTYAVRFDGKSTVAGYDPDKYLAQYNSAKGNSSQAKINALRRENYAKNKDSINARKRELYAEQTRRSLRANKKTANMSTEEYVRASELWKQVDELELTQREKEYVYEELDNNLTTEERESAIVSRAIGSYRYSAVNKGHNQYKIYRKEPIELIDSVLDEVLDFDWRSLW